MERNSGEGSDGIYTEFTAEPESTYTFSAYVKVAAGSAYLSMNNGDSTARSEVEGPTNEWVRLQVSLTNNTSTTQTMSVQVMLDANSTVYVDCVQVEKTPTASRYNLIDNGDFRNNSTWSDTNGLISAVSSAAPQLDNRVYQMVGNPTGSNRISQTIPVSGSAGDTFVLSGWAMGNSVSLENLNNSDNQRRFSIIAEFNYTDEVETDEFVLNFNTDVDNWQYSAAPIVAKRDYASITVYLAYDYNANTACFDGIQLYQEEFGNSYTYDEDGNVTSVVDLQKKTTTYEYENGDLTQIIQDNKAKMTYTYDDYHNVLTATSSEGLRYKFTYDTYGNNTSVSIVKAEKNGEEWEEVEDSPSITTSAVYSANGNYLLSTTDAAGNVTTYNYDPQTNVLLSVKYPNDTDDTKTTYTYDAMYRLASAQAQAGTETLTASYTYENDLLTQITTGSTTYNFGYGDFALRSSISVGNSVLATYEYESRTNYLNTLAYGNGDVVEYEYDNLGRVTMQEYEDGDTVTYQYDNNGALATITDSATGRKTTYYYDFTDRLMKYVESGTGYYHSVGYEYDTLNNLTTLVETINGVERTTSYEYDEDNRVTSINTGSSNRAYTYDDWGRVNQRITRHGDTDILSESLVYRTLDSNTTTGQVGSLIVDTADYDVTYTYTYDDNGNIKTVSDGTNTTTYTYDTQNQLIREDNQAAGKSWTWEYDDAGNILNRKEYAYTTSTLGTATDTITYGYGNTNWGDLLTSYDGQTITYDAIGNPLTDGTWTYTWEHGRQLASMSNGSTTWSYTYDANGMRTSRTDGSNTYSYVYNGSQLSQMVYVTNGTTITFNFYYDAAGQPLSVNIDGTDYYYVANLQGDITAILNASGTKVVSYEYDAWGKVTDCQIVPATTSDFYLAFNPLRYRGYVFDVETELYYLQSRYYDPEIGRFLNSDVFAATGQGLLGNNMFAYCGNNPAMFADYSGFAPISLKSTFFYVCYDGAGSHCPNPDDTFVLPGVGDGNYYSFDREDLAIETVTVYADIDQVEVFELTKEISSENLSAQSGVIFNFLPGWIGPVYDAFIWAEGYTEKGHTDRTGNQLYLEAGYTVVVLKRVYYSITERYSAAENEYFVYDKNQNLVYNDTVLISWFIG